MIGLIIKNIDGYIYTLIDKDNKEYKLNIEFYKIIPSVNDIIYVPEKIIKEKNIYTYGPVERQSVSDDLIKLIHDNEEILLQRYYG